MYRYNRIIAVIALSQSWEANKPSSVFRIGALCKITSAFRLAAFHSRNLTWAPDPKGGSFLYDADYSAPPAAYPGLATLVRLWRGPRLVPYLALLRVGFTMPSLSPADAVVSYTTVSPLPVPECASFDARPSAVCSLWHFPSPYDARSLTGTLPCGARTFLEWAGPLSATRDPHSLPSAFKNRFS